MLRLIPLLAFLLLLFSTCKKERIEEYSDCSKALEGIQLQVYGSPIIGSDFTIGLNGYASYSCEKVIWTKPDGTTVTNFGGVGYYVDKVTTGDLGVYDAEIINGLCHVHLSINVGSSTPTCNPIDNTINVPNVVGYSNSSLTSVLPSSSGNRFRVDCSNWPGIAQVTVQLNQGTPVPGIYDTENDFARFASYTPSSGKYAYVTISSGSYSLRAREKVFVILRPNGKTEITVCNVQIQTSSFFSDLTTRIVF